MTEENPYEAPSVQEIDCAADVVSTSSMITGPG